MGLRDQAHGGPSISDQTTQIVIMLFGPRAKSSNCFGFWGPILIPIPREAAEALPLTRAMPLRGERRRLIGTRKCPGRLYSGCLYCSCVVTLPGEQTVTEI